MNLIAAKTTPYMGTQFRSRTEAKWAVFFDAIKLPWRYEEVGYGAIDWATRPDFVLTFGDENQGEEVLFEVKGQHPGELYIARRRQLATECRKRFVIAISTYEDLQRKSHRDYYAAKPGPLLVLNGRTFSESPLYGGDTHERFYVCEKCAYPALIDERFLRLRCPRCNGMMPAALPYKAFEKAKHFRAWDPA